MNCAIVAQSKLAKIEMDAYVMESMAYVTAGILDSVVHPDAAVESAIVKVHTNCEFLLCTLITCVPFCYCICVWIKQSLHVMYRVSK